MLYLHLGAGAPPPPSRTAAALVRRSFADAALGALGTARRAARAAAWRKGGGRDESVG